MDKEQPLVNKTLLLEKYPGKGGWTYAAIPDIQQNPKTAFGWMTVRGFIDDYALHHYKLMPMGNGKLFLPVKADIREKIGKTAGDLVNIVLYRDDSPFPIPEELQQCLQDAPDAFTAFQQCTEGQQKKWVDWIYAAKTEATRIKRISGIIQELEKSKSRPATGSIGQ